MKKVRTNKGITLVSLVITIIVLLILTIVSIKLLTDNGIIGHATKVVKQYEEAEFEEKLGLVFQAQVMSNYAGEKVNNKKLANGILDIFRYPNIDEETGLAKDTTDGTITEVAYTMTSENGQVKIKENASSKLLLQVFYDKNDKPEFKIIYNGKIYEYNNSQLSSKTEYYVEGNVADWEYTEDEDETLTLTKYLGAGEQDSSNVDILNLTVPNKLDGKIVKTANIATSTQLSKISGILKVSAGITVKKINTTNITKIELEENVTTTNPNANQGNITIGGNNITDLAIKSGCYVDARPVGASLKDVELENNVTLNNRVFFNTSSLTEQSVNKILEKAKLIGNENFVKCYFVNPINIVVPENKEIIANSLFYDCTNISTISIKRNSTLGTNDIMYAIFECSNLEIDKITIEDNCSVRNLFRDSSNIIINQVKIGNNVTLPTKNVSSWYRRVNKRGYNKQTRNWK